MINQYEDTALEGVLCVNRAQAIQAQAGRVYLSRAEKEALADGLKCAVRMPLHIDYLQQTEAPNLARQYVAEWGAGYGRRAGFDSSLAPGN